MTDHILELFAERSSRILEHSRRFLKIQKNELADVNRWSADTINRLLPFMERGKCIRGNLVLLGAEIGDAPLSDGVYAAAAAIELFQSSILIHDDIIDQDTVRRGETTIHTQYSEKASAELQSSSADHIGASLAICVGDVGFNLTYALLARSELPDRIKVALTSFWGVEFAKVGLAEMDDVYMSFMSGPAPLERIVALYRYKTARYTFCVPFLTGLIIADASADVRNTVEELGDVLGLMFQIKDDELGIFGDEATVGKPVGSDIRENKKTIFHHFLMSLDDKKLLAELSPLFGKETISTEELNCIRTAIVASGIKVRVDARITALSEQALNCINRLNAPETQKDFLTQFVHYNMNRTH
jgi:geranylgeranyl diphosphate synthase type I